MSVKSFKFVSPGVFINEIDNSFVPKSADAIGPVVVGRSVRGLAMQPVKVESYSDFVTMFGDTVPGSGGGDVYRDGNYQSPMYGTYAAKAFLRANVAPVTYVRLLGQQDSNGTSGGVAGWQTTQNPSDQSGSITRGVNEPNGGAFGMWLFASSSLADASNQPGSGTLAAIFYADRSASFELTGNVAGETSNTGSGYGVLVNNDSSYNFTLTLSESLNGTQQVSFNFDDTSELFIRKAFNTNPQLTTTPGGFYPSASAKTYWLGETFEQSVRDASLVGAAAVATVVPIALSGSTSSGPHAMRQASREAVAGWFIGQDSGHSSSFNPELSQKLFRLKGRGHGEWLHKNCKVSIAKLRKTTSTSTDYGTFSVLIRSLSDTDNKVSILERFDNCTLDPTSPNFVARKIGDKYNSWNSTERALKTYGEYTNNSKFVYVEMNADVEAGATDPLLLPFGYFGPPRPRHVLHLSQSTSQTSSYMGLPCSGSGPVTHTPAGESRYRESPLIGYPAGIINACTGSLSFPEVRLRVSASDGGLTDATKAYFGMQTTRTATSTTHDVSVGDFHRLWLPTSLIPDDPTTYATKHPSALPGVCAYGYVFSMNDISASAGGQYSYQSGSRRGVNSNGHNGAVTDSTLLNAGYDSFTAPFWGGYDGWNIIYPDPAYNASLTSGTDTNNYGFYTWKRAIDTVSDPEFVDMNLLVAPGLTHDALTGHMIDVCEERADSLAMIDLASVYIPSHEAYYSSKADRIAADPTQRGIDLKDRQIDSSYGCTFYPWVQTRDANTGQMLWIPPSVAMMGVLASSQAKSDVWFAPAGFNRGGLTDGAAGIPVTGVTERLTSKNRDTLYESNINPIASFPSSGIVVFGQKTLQERQSALDRINVRRLVIFLKKQISILSTQVLFEQNVQSTWNRFKSLIEPFLANVKTRFGITDYRLILDESTTTPDLIDQNILYAKIMIKPARAIEFIAIDFVIASTGASFDD